MMAGKHIVEDQIEEEYSLFGGSDKLKPLRDTLMGGLYGDHLKTPGSEEGFATQRDEGKYQEGPEEHTDTCNARRFWGEGSSPVAAPDPWFSLAGFYAFGISQTLMNKTSWPIRKAPCVSCWSTERLPEAFPCLNISSCLVCLWTCGNTSSCQEVQSQYPVARAASAFSCLKGFQPPDNSGSPAVAVDTLSHCPQEGGRRAGANSTRAMGRGHQSGSPSGQASGSSQWGSLPPPSPAPQPLPPSPTPDVELQSHCPNISVPQARACRHRPCARPRPHPRLRLHLEH
ncbi:uncharacterized protein LOC113836993 [Cricetulus griseus]|uniref:Uncharacterized protein LOC113836993 n=1 Tax=Cricetulus griseus TaxID=10029 RepID=A0A9J7JWQ8_CRIGR|nr:uncharacterized protein LOC113836993 [Cricetulus griseus]